MFSLFVKEDFIYYFEYFNEYMELKVIYFRWLMFCYIPTFCDSLQRYDTTDVFGRTLLRVLLKYLRQQIMDWFFKEKNNIPIQRRSVLSTNFPLFLNQLDEDVSDEKSPVWDVNFKMQLLPVQTLADSTWKGEYTDSNIEY